MIQLTLTLKMTTAQVVETSVNVNDNSPIQDYVHPDDQTQPTFKKTPGFKPFTDAYSYHIWRAWYNGSYLMARTIRALEFHYPMIQFLIIVFISFFKDYYIASRPSEANALFQHFLFFLDLPCLCSWNGSFGKYDQLCLSSI